MTTATQAPVLRIERLSKTFPGTRALIDVSLEIEAGEIQALVGQNGSGKSTLVKTLAGFHHADPGAEAWLEGEPFDVAKVSDARHDRLRFVHQDLGLVLELGVMDNLALRHKFARHRLGNIDWRTQERTARKLLDSFGVDIDVRTPLAQATPVDRVVVAIVAALQGWEGGTGLLVLDEPTALLPPNEVARLFEIVGEVRRSGTSVLYVSHRLDEIFQIADRVSVIREGRLVATEPVSELTPRSLATMMVGEDVDAEYRVTIASDRSAPIALEAREIRARYLRGASLTLRQGEVLGVAGLLGSGREELPYALSGALGTAAEGFVRIPIRSSEWIALGRKRLLDVPLVPADRQREAVVEEFEVGENLTLSVLESMRGRLALSERRERRVVSEWIERLSIRTAGADAAITTLSGGNQQKVVMARCLAREAPLLLLCEPTAGVDIGARIAIYDLIADQVRAGLGVLVSSSDVGDLLAICTRVLVFRDGVVAREIEREELSEATLLHAMEGTE